MTLHLSENYKRVLIKISVISVNSERLVLTKKRVPIKNSAISVNMIYFYNLLIIERILRRSHGSYSGLLASSSASSSKNS